LWPEPTELQRKKPLLRLFLRVQVLPVASMLQIFAQVTTHFMESHGHALPAVATESK
jgi:hypothetical protein